MLGKGPGASVVYSNLMRSLFDIEKKRKKESLQSMFSIAFNVFTDKSELDERADAFVFFVFMKGGRSGNLYRMSITDAKVLCSQPETAGVSNFGGHWMLMWNRCAHDIHGDNPEEQEWVQDDGRFDKMMERLGVVVKHRVIKG